MAVNIIAGQALNRVIGRGIEIPWRAKGEQLLFKRLTLGGVLVMGRKTFESIGRPLPGRQTVIVTRQPGFAVEGCHTVDSIEAAVDLGRTLGEVFIAGGGEIYAQSMALADGVHLTTVQTEPEGDVFFPEMPANESTLVRGTWYASNINYLYQYYRRRLAK